MTIAALFGGSAGSRLARWLTMYGADVNAQLIAPYRLREVDLKTSMKYTSCGTALRIALQNKDQGLAETLLDLGINLKLTFGTGPKEEAAYSSKILTLCHGSKSLERIVFAAFKKEQEADKEKQKTADEALGKKLREVIKSGGSPATLIRDLKEQKSATKTKKTQENISAPKQF